MSPSAHLVSGLPSTALIVIDVQQAFNDPYYLNRERSTPNLEPNITSLLTAFRAQGLPIIHIHHVNTKNDSSLWYEATRPTGVLPMEYVAPKDDELVLRKYSKSSAFGAFLLSDGTTSLAEVLDARGIKTVILVGISSAHCVNSTARSASDLGLLVVVVGDATATHASDAVDFGGAKGDGRDGISWAAETAHAVSMAQLQGEFADVVTTTEVLKYL
ncbi:Isochorismatase-like protein [Mycena albidolilacea]|uniref:Isochorismatase-like protein n=1 Tax=Mycena albidolilacea TaxID=1033008 RepID=A0AAD6ZN69_9AGAR|nr:Isochorismatase-like protein [Mycena albidolilacea]